ncbi:uncharacterized protein [Argopecten irradians]|uniref:uncharacterized protein isoform X1 n=1 Tax=Argopecten irradians TaxID=31199 RepID=UPI00371DAC24
MKDPYHLYASAEVRRGSVLITTVAKQGPHTETDKHPYHVYASADGEVRRENVPTTVSKHAPQTGSDERATENANKDDREYLELYQSAGTTDNTIQDNGYMDMNQSKGAAVNATGDDQEYMDMNQSTVGDENTTEDGRKYQDLYQTTDPEHLYDKNQ